MADSHSEGIANRSPISGKETRTCVFLALGFLFVFAAFLALQNLQGSLNDEGGLGVISLSCLYAAAILSAIFAPTVITVVGVKRSVMMAFIGHLIYVSSNFYPSFYTLVPSSIILGVVTGPLWTSQGIYLTSCAVSTTERTGVKLYTSLSTINGIFFTMFEMSNIAGNLVSSLVLYQGQYNATYTMNTSYFCGSNDCPNEETVDLIADPESRVVYILLGLYLACVAAGLGTVTIFLPPIQKQIPTNRNAIKKSLMSWFRLISDTDIKFLLPFFFYVAIEQVIIFTEITKSYVSCPIGIQNVGYVMTSYGVCSALCTFIFSRIARFTRRYILLGCAGTLQMALMLWMYHWIPTTGDTIKIYVLASSWGVGEGVWKTQTNVVLGKIFSDNKQAAFAVYEGMKSVAFTLTFVYSSLLCMYIKLIIAMAILALGLTLYGVVEIRFRRKQQMETEVNNGEEETIET